MVQHVDWALTEAVEHLALDEALLHAADSGDIGETIRMWEFDAVTVVVGRSSRVETEVDRERCQREGVPILRRCSGGASIVGGAGCLMYSVILSLEQRPELRKIDAAHRFVMQRVLAAIRSQIPEVVFQGTSDLTWQNRKFSGNSLRIARHHLLYHGTVLYEFDLQHISRYLLHAPRQPEYRDRRDHHEFVTNIPVDAKRLTAGLLEQFDASTINADVHAIRGLQTAVHTWRRNRYDDPGWHFRH